MKIVILDDCYTRVEILDVEDSIIFGVYGNDVDKFLMAMGYDDVTWMAAPIDYVPVVYRNFKLNDNGEISRTEREDKLKDFSVEQEYRKTNEREIAALLEKMRIYGKPTDEGVRVFAFEKGSEPVVAAFLCDEPVDFKVVRVILNENGKLNLEGEDKEGYMGFPGLQLISAEDVFYGHLEYVTGNIR